VLAAARGDQGARALFATTAHRLVECADLASGRDADEPGDLAAELTAAVARPGQVDADA
jgi:hypothetical protein